MELLCWSSLKPNHRGVLLGHLVLAWWLLFHRNAAGAARDVVDMSHVFDNDTIYWVTARKLTLNVTYNGTAPGKDYWYQTDEISAATHGGTHLDAPCHFARGRWCVSDIPLDHLIAPAAVVDISSHVRDDPNVHLSTDHLLEWERTNGPIPEGSLLLIHTGWSRFWPDPSTYSGTTERVASKLRFPSVKGEVAQWLVSNRKIVGLGLDVMSLDIPNSNREVHVTLMERNIYGLENVNNIHLLPPTGSMVYVMPMKLKDASGAPCRIFAQLPQASAAGSGHNVVSSNVVRWLFLSGLLFLRKHMDV